MDRMNKYIREYAGNFVFEHTEHISTRISGIEIAMDIWEYHDSRNRREKAYVTAKKDDLIYACEFYDHHNYKNSFFPVTLHGQQYLCFRKTLYGFTLLNADTLTPEHEYFPECVAADGDDFEESFIIMDVKQLDDLLIFFGCYWAGSYGCFAFDHHTKLFLNVSKMRDLDSVDRLEIHNDRLILYSTDEEDTEVQISVSGQEIVQGLQKQGDTDF